MIWMAYNKVVYGGNVLVDLTSNDIDSESLLAGKQALGADGEMVTGGMTNRGAVTGTIATKAGTYTVQKGYHSGTGTVGISSTEQAKIISGNIKSGVQILGVTGSYGGEAPSTQEKTVTSSTSVQTVTPDTGMYLSKVTVNAIPYVESSLAGGTCVTIG